jgi:hypothetical protein
VDLDRLAPGQSIKVPVTLALDQYRAGGSGSSSSSSSSSGSGNSSGGGVPDYLRHGAVAALAHATAMGSTPRDGLVAVKVLHRLPTARLPDCPTARLSACFSNLPRLTQAQQLRLRPPPPTPRPPPAAQVQYPEAQQTMARDLVNLRAVAAFLSRTEIKFDMLSAVEELQKQIHLEFEFKR